jgi:pimeloyl-ACP methyl ester carboxylesterase
VLQPNYRGSAGYGESWFKNNGFQSWRTAIGDVNDAGPLACAEGIADPAKLAIVGWSYGGYAALQSGALDPDLYKAVVAIAPVTDLKDLVMEARNWSNARYVESMIGSGPHVLRLSDPECPQAQGAGADVPWRPRPQRVRGSGADDAGSAAECRQDG